MSEFASTWQAGAKKSTLSIIIPCYNEEKTLAQCLDRVVELQSDDLELEILIVNDCSRDRSQEVAEKYAASHPRYRIKVLRHEVNQGKGAALHTGFRGATGDFVAIQDADLEYNPLELRRLLNPLIANEADVVIGSRFLSGGAHRVLYFWHSLGNRFLTLLSNMLTDLNLTDMETCYKVFRRDVIQGLELCEKRFGFEPEVVAKIAQKRLRIYEMGISYFGRTYAEGKKIGMKDGFRALYCILKYNLPKVPAPIQFVFYVLIGGISALINLAVFLALFHSGMAALPAALIAFVGAAVVNYALSVAILFRSAAQWGKFQELAIYAAIVAVLGLVDSYGTHALLGAGLSPVGAKLLATGVGLVLNFLARKYLVFYEKPNPDWKPQSSGKVEG